MGREIEDMQARRCAVSAIGKIKGEKPVLVNGVSSVPLKQENSMKSSRQYDAHKT